jgi:polysaccharide pyruvyl transferase
MKKIAILTQPLYVNYGGILQNFALQYILKEMGFDPITVNRIGKRPSRMRKTLQVIKNQTYNKLKNKDRIIFTDGQKKYIIENPQSFIRKHIKVSPDLDSTNALKNFFEKKHFDAVVVGSDQTWRPSISANIFNYFLDFLEYDNKIKKISYAASFGVDFLEYDTESTKKIRKLVKEFDAISVRENSGVDLCVNYLGVPATHVCDPTILLDKKIYQSLFDKNSQVPNRGLYTYVLDKSIAKKQFILDIGKHLDIKAFKCQPEKDLFYEKSKNINDFIPPKIEHWIEGFHNADFVVTDSFHGTVFSILFNKPFLTLVNKERGAARFYSFLSDFNLQNRLVEDVNNYDIKLLYSEIDYNSVNKKIEEFKSKSIEFLKNNLA